MTRRTASAICWNAAGRAWSNGVVLRALVLFAAACEASAAPAQVDGFVLDKHGPVGGVDLELFGLPPAACPCPDAVLTTATGSIMTPGNLPCQCPAALGVWRDQLAHCGTATPLAHARSESGGHFALPLAAGATALVAVRANGERWIALPAPQGATLELGDRVIAHVKITGNESVLRAGIVYPDGHCVPLVRSGVEWLSTSGVSAREDGVVAAESATGFAAVDWHPGFSATEELDLAPATTVSGACSRSGLEVRFDGPYQHLVGRSGPKGAFQIPHALWYPAVVSCRDGHGTVVDELLYEPGSGIGDDRDLRSSDNECTPIEIIDGNGKPVAGARISVWDDPVTPRSGHIISSDAHGRACVDARRLTVAAPPLLGGDCAGSREITIAWHPADPKSPPYRRIELPITQLPHTTWHGRLVTPEHVPVAGGGVYVERIRMADGCEELIEEWLETKLDGSFALPVLPSSKVTLEIQHPWYADKTFEVDNRGPARDLVLDRGASWYARVLDPDGNPITKCAITINEPGGHALYDHCGPHGELALDALAPGVTRFAITIEKHPLGEHRTFWFDMPIKAKEHRTDDVRWPQGVTIAGRTVDKHGLPVIGARVSAIPKGELRPVSQMAEHEVTIISDANGRFELRHMAPGTWTLSGNGHAAVEAVAGSTNVAVIAR